MSEGRVLYFLSEYIISFLKELYLIFRDISYDADCKARAREGLTPYEFFGYAELFSDCSYLGEVSEDRVPDIKAAMDKLYVPELTLTFDRVGCFRRDSELWWIGLKEDPALLKLQKELSAFLKDAGFRLESRKFKPHITLAREMHIGHTDNKTLLPEPFETKADEISLMLSSRPNGKLTYTELYSTEQTQ